jgi:hypothetical protein
MREHYIQYLNRYLKGGKSMPYYYSFSRDDHLPESFAKGICSTFEQWQDAKIMNGIRYVKNAERRGIKVATLFQREPKETETLIMHNGMPYIVPKLISCRKRQFKNTLQLLNSLQDKRHEAIKNIIQFITKHHLQRDDLKLTISQSKFFMKLDYSNAHSRWHKKIKLELNAPLEFFQEDTFRGTHDWLAVFYRGSTQQDNVTVMQYGSVPAKSMKLVKGSPPKIFTITELIDRYFINQDDILVSGKSVDATIAAYHRAIQKQVLMQLE